MSSQLDKTFEPSRIEEKWYRFWEENDYFQADAMARGESFVIVIPPPNVTGRLHMGHALNDTLQDILTRWSRMRGRNTLWLPGTDHAGIATQNVVERKLREQSIDRRELGREKFVERVWQWREEYGGIILQQLRQMGCSCDWSRTRFTLDEGLSRAVRAVFKRLYDEGLVYRGTYLVNWCPVDQTALSDDEVEYREVQGHLWHIRYPLADGLKAPDGKDHIVVATTRPETMLGDTAVAMNPGDERYRHLTEARCRLPLTDRTIPFIQDDHVDPAFGTGLVKVTPAHDPNDYEMGKRHDLEMLNILEPDGRLNTAVPEPYRGLPAREARKKIVADLEAAGLIEKIEDHTHQVGHSYRSHAVVEPYISEQWFVKMRPLAEPAIRAVEQGDVRFVPKQWENTYFHWMRNVRDWCISRQLWWGHQIPVWYCLDCEHVNVSDAEDCSRCEQCGSTNLKQDEDVLDTWFSSALWPFSTMGWPDQTDDLHAFYPTSTLLTAHEIIFFWVARMIIMGLKFMDDVPFRDVYIHPMVFDVKTKKKMSKSLGNIIDPIEMIDRYGSDAMRMTVAAYAVQGANLYLSEERFEGYRNFMNKFWNSARFVLMNTEDLTAQDLARSLDEDALEIEDHWILDELMATIERCDNALQGYNFDQYVHHLYHFTWGVYCDWYLELVKFRLYSRGRDDEHALAASRRNAQILLITVLENLCRLLHPVAPFISEEVWVQIRERYAADLAPGLNLGLGDSFQQDSLIVAPWPEADNFIEPDGWALERMRLMMEAIRAIRRIRSEMNVPPSQAVEVCLSDDEPGRVEALLGQWRHFEALARVGRLQGGEFQNPEAARHAATAVAGTLTIRVALPPELLAAERERLDKDLAKLEKFLGGLEKKLGNDSFVAKAPAEVVEKERARLEETRQQVEVLRARRSELGG